MHVLGALLVDCLAMKLWGPVDVGCRGQTSHEWSQPRRALLAIRVLCIYVRYARTDHADIGACVRACGCKYVCICTYVDIDR